MTERTVKLSDREVRALAYIEAASYLNIGSEGLFNDYPHVERASLSAVSDMVGELCGGLEAASMAAVGGREAFNALLLKTLSGKENGK